MTLGARARSRAPRRRPEFAIVGAAHVPFAAAPTMLFEAIATEPTGAAIQSIALTAQVMIDPARRGYDAETRERLTELFGPPASWAPSTSGLPWARVAAAVPGFTGETAVLARGAVHVRPRGRGRQVLLRRRATARCR